jgi:ferritin
MNLTTSLNEVFNEQIVKEYSNVLAYAQLQSFFEDKQLTKIAKYFGERSDEEKTHANKFMAHINARTGGKVTIGEVPAPDFGNEMTPAEIGDLYVQREEDTTESIEAIYELADSEKSFIDLPFILEMLDEQVSEEDEANEFSLKAKDVKDLVLWDASFE